MANKPIATTALLITILCASAFLAISIGSVKIPPNIIYELIIDKMALVETNSNHTAKLATILFDIRMPRVALMGLTGASLATAGATYQGLFRNPLADPYLVGVASGAGLGATIAITLNLYNNPIGLSTITIAAFFGGIITAFIVVLTARIKNTTPVTTMLLAGIAIGSFATAITTLIKIGRAHV